MGKIRIVIKRHSDHYTIRPQVFKNSKWSDVLDEHKIKAARILGNESIVLSNRRIEKAKNLLMDEIKDKYPDHKVVKYVKEKEEEIKKDKKKKARVCSVCGKKLFYLSCSDKCTECRMGFGPKLKKDEQEDLND